MILKLHQTPLSNKRPLSNKNDSKILGIGKKVQNHLNYSVSCLIYEALLISSCSMSSLK